jgi:MFS family permease
MTGERAFPRDLLFYRFCTYGFLKNLRFFEPFMVLYFRSIGLSFLEIGILFGIRDGATWLLELPTGFVADIFGRRASMVASMLAYLGSFAVFHMFHVFWMCAGAMAVFGAGEAFRTGTHKALILEHLRAEGISEYRVDYYGATRGASQIGSAVNSLIAAGLVFATGSFRFIFIAAMAPYVLNLINLATYPKRLDGHLEGEHHRVRMKETFRHFRDALTRGPAVKGILNSSVFDGFFTAAKEYLQPVLKTMALSLPLFTALSGDRRTAIAVGAVYFVLYLGTSWACRSAGRFSRRIRSQSSAVNLTFLTGAAVLALAGLMQWISLPAVAVVLFVSMFLLENLRRPILLAWISERISHRAMASGLSAESQAKSLVGVAVAPLLGLLADTAGVGPALLVTAVLMAGSLLLVRLRNEADQSAVFSG